MNQDQVKEILLQIKSEVPDFQVIFSGKERRKVDGLYKPDTQEIIIHNKNFKESHSLIFTAVHEFAHHILFHEEGWNVSKSHNTHFWNTFYDLLDEAEKKGLWIDPLKKEEELLKKIKEVQDSLSGVTKKEKDVGRDFIKVVELALNCGVEVNHICRRYLRMKPATMKHYVMLFVTNISSDLSPDASLEVSRIKNLEKRELLQASLTEGRTISQAKESILGRVETEESERDQIADMWQQIARLEKEVTKREHRIEELKAQIESIQESANG